MPDTTAPASTPPLNLYEVVRWGNDSDCVHTGGPNGRDTCFLVRASSVEEAAELADVQLRYERPTQVDDHAHVVHLLGVEASTQRDARVLRGPYHQAAYTHGWRSWGRWEKDDPWKES